MKVLSYSIAFLLAMQWALSCPLGPYCTVDFEFYTQSRRVYNNNLTQECPGGGHSAPFGNWAADSGWDQPYDGNQFPGWKKEWSWNTFSFNYQWNSCTSQSAYSPPNCSYFNANSCTQQLTTRGPEKYHRGRLSEKRSVGCVREEIGIGGCRRLNGYFSRYNEWLALYEFDPPSGLAFVTTLDVGSLTANLSCDAYSCQPASSGWTLDITNGVEALFQMQVLGAGYSDPYGVCRPW